MSFTDGRFNGIVRYIAYVASQCFEEVRFFLLKPLIYFCPKKHRDLLLKLRKHGYVVIKGYFSPAEIEAINNEVDRAIRPLLSTSHPGLSVIPGSARFRRPEINNLLFRSLAREIYWIAIHAIYNGSLRVPVLMLSFTEKYDESSSAVPPNGPVEYFASQPHFDSFRHELKVVVALTEVNETSGPTEIAVESSNYHFVYWKEYFSSWLTDRGILQSKTKTISEDFYQHFRAREKILLSPGDVAIFDARNIHRATPLIYGKRELLWYYF